MSAAGARGRTIGPSADTSRLASLPELLGAAVALGAERVGPLSAAEVKLCTTLVRPAARELRALRELIREGQDPLGDAFCVLRPPERRRMDGATYTPTAIVQAMVDWAAQGPIPARVLDPGAGSGRFAIAAGHRFPTADLLAVEIDPVAALIGRANLATSGMGHRATVLVGDFRGAKPSRIDGPTLYIGNPPYVRHHLIEPEWKGWLTQTAAARGLRVSQLAGLHVYFFLATAANASPGDRGAFITASEWLDVNYGALVRDLVLDGLGGKAIHVVAPEARPFEDAHTTAAITCFEVGSKPTSVRLRRVARVEDLANLSGGQQVRRERLAEATRWTPLLRAARRVPQGHIELGELCRVHRGAVTGANRVWVVDSDKSDLPERLMFPAVTRARELFAARVELASTTGLRSVIDLPEDLDELDRPERILVERLLRAARRLGVHRGYIASHRRAWWSVGLREPAPLLATYMARRPPAIVHNRAEARHINIAHGLYPRQQMDESAITRLAAALRECIDISHGRTYAGGLTKFEPREMERLLIPDVTAVGA